MYENKYIECAWFLRMNNKALIINKIIKNDR